MGRVTPVLHYKFYNIYMSTLRIVVLFKFSLYWCLRRQLPYKAIFNVHVSIDRFGTGQMNYGTRVHIGTWNLVQCSIVHVFMLKSVVLSKL